MAEGEGHVPCLAGEDREDRRRLHAENGAGEQRHPNGDRGGQEAEDRHRLQDVEQRYQHHAQSPASGRRQTIDEAEHQ